MWVIPLRAIVDSDSEGRRLGGSHEPHVIIYPGFKNGEFPAPLDSFHRHFQTCVGEASVLVIIGYAFRDAHINATLRQRTRPDATVVVINPQERFDDTPIHARIVHHLQEGFGEGSVAKKCLEQIRYAAERAVPASERARHATLGRFAPVAFEPAAFP